MNEIVDWDFADCVYVMLWFGKIILATAIIVGVPMLIYLGIKWLYENIWWSMIFHPLAEWFREKRRKYLRKRNIYITRRDRRRTYQKTAKAKKKERRYF